MKISLPAEKRFLVLAVNRAGVDFVKYLLLQGVKKNDVIIVFDRNRKPAETGLLPQGVRSFEVVCSDTEQLMTIYSSVKANICCVFGWYSILRRKFIDQFSGCIFNMHFGDLPLYRGAGGFSWQVLNAHQTLGAQIHQLLPKVDAGPVICSAIRQIEKLEPYPVDFIELSTYVADDVVSELALLLVKYAELEALEQNEEEAEYFPKLTTSENGVIDFSWASKELSRFIRAFSHPYPGASFIYKGQIYRVLRVGILKSGILRHPFCAGLIVNRSSAGLHVALRDGIVVLDDFRDDKGSDIDIETFRIGDRLINSISDLEHSRVFRP